ncbi:MAG: transglutaminase TgpA family protein, partial [Halioglobus sp.]
AMLLQALPLMIVLFFLFPRFGPLWTVPIKSHSAKTGMSDFMKPGDVARLSRTGGVAFRVKFEGDIPDQSQLYWRGLIFSRFEGGAWSALSPYTIPLGERRTRDIDTEGDSIAYSVIMEPTQQNWLYGLRFARSTTPGVMISPDYRLYRPGILEVETMYKVNTWPDTPLGVELSDWRRDIETKLPGDGNPRARALALDMRANAGSDAEYVDNVVNRFTRENYVYTLEPGLLPEPDRIDGFLFDTMRGFCEHYASAFVFMMRAAGLPARVVAGYQGGEVNPVNGTVIVHQFDAHAWAEVWLPGEGWVRVDPTAAVAPERIEWGLEEAMQGEGSFLANTPLSPLRYRNINLLNQMRLRYDALTYRWQSWVVGFNSEQQFDMFQRYLGKVDARKFAAVLLGSWALVLIPVAFVLMRRRKVRVVSPLDKAYLKFCTRMEKLGVQRFPGESPAQFARRAAARLPALAGQLAEIARLYDELAYAPSGAAMDTESLSRFERVVADFRPGRRDRTPT